MAGQIVSSPRTGHPKEGKGIMLFHTSIDIAVSEADNPTASLNKYNGSE